jgi:hypothetical protein
MELHEAESILQTKPLRLETGFERLPSGVLHVAVRTDMHNCNGEMFEWWFRWRCDTQKYVWWHPVDHVSSEWHGLLSDTTHIGSEHFATERLTGMPALDAVVQFREPSEFFNPEDYAAARAEGRISCAVLGRIGIGHNPDRLEDGTVLGGRLLHVGRDTPWGLALRSHFYIGQDLPAAGLSAAQVTETATDEFGESLLQHAYNEFTYLSRFLPSLFIAEHRDERAPALPW